MTHPLDYVDDDLDAVFGPVDLDALPSIELPSAQAESPTLSTVPDLARQMSPQALRRLLAIASNTVNLQAARSACRDILQVAGHLVEHTRVDVLVSFRALFAQMSPEEIDNFRDKKGFPERLRHEALKLLEHAPKSAA